MKKLGMPSSGFFFLWSISFFLQKKKESENAVSWVGDLFPDSSMTDVAANNLNGASVNSPSQSTGTDGQRNTEVPPGQTDSQNQDTSNAMLGAAYSEARRPEEEVQVTLGDTAGNDPEEDSTDEEVATDESQTYPNTDNSNTAASPWYSFLGSALGLVGLTFAGRGNSSEENPLAENQNASGETGNEPEVTPENLMSYLQENGSYTDPATGNEYFLDPLGRFGVTTTDPETGERTSMVRDPETGNLMDYNPNDFQNASYGNESNPKSGYDVLYDLKASGETANIKISYDKIGTDGTLIPIIDEPVENILSGRESEVRGILNNGIKIFDPETGEPIIDPETGEQKITKITDPIKLEAAVKSILQQQENAENSLRAKDNMPPFGSEFNKNTGLVKVTLTVEPINPNAVSIDANGNVTFNINANTNRSSANQVQFEYFPSQYISDSGTGVNTLYKVESGFNPEGQRVYYYKSLGPLPDNTYYRGTKFPDLDPGQPGVANIIIENNRKTNLQSYPPSKAYPGMRY